MNGRLELRDLVRDRVVKRFPTTASRHGRYVTWFEYGDLPLDPVTGSYPGGRWVIVDRTTGTRHDLGDALRAAGYQPRPGDPVLSGDGRIAFLYTDRGAVAVRWSPGP